MINNTIFSSPMVLFNKGLETIFFNTILFNNYLEIIIIIHLFIKV